jgi:hypothetical protein
MKEGRELTQIRRAQNGRKERQEHGMKERRELTQIPFLNDKQRAGMAKRVREWQRGCGPGRIGAAAGVRELH